jgi:hypothetical protein
VNFFIFESFNRKKIIDLLTQSVFIFLIWAILKFLWSIEKPWSCTTLVVTNIHI